MYYFFSVYPSHDTHKIGVIWVDGDSDACGKRLHEIFGCFSGQYGPLDDYRDRKGIVILSPLFGGYKSLEV